MGKPKPDDAQSLDQLIETGRQRMDREAEREHKRALLEMLDRMPHPDTVESRAVDRLMRKVVGDGKGTGDWEGITWQGGVRGVARRRGKG